MARAPVDEIPQPNDDFLVEDAMLERIWEELHVELGISKKYDAQFLTWIVPARERLVKGIYRHDGMKAAFQVTSPDPNGKDDKDLRTFGMTPYDEYKQALTEYGHYVSKGDHPAKTIFRHLLRAHAKSMGAIKGITEMDEKTYQKNLDAARWIAEMAQGDKFEPGKTMY